VPGFKRAPLEPGPLAELMDAMHALHLLAGHPSTRDLERAIRDSGTVSHAAIHKAFTGSKLPTWRLVEPLVLAMAPRANRDAQAEVERVRVLWTNAARPDSTPTEPQPDNSTVKADSQTSDREFSRPISELLAGALDEIEPLGANERSDAFRIPTGFTDLDALLGGWSQGYLIVVGGRPSSGKTNLLLQSCRAAAIKYRLPSMFITGEMNSKEIRSRLLSAEARVSSHHMKVGHVTDRERELLARAMSLIADCPIHIATPPDFEIERVSADVARLARQAGLRLLLVDSLQWMTEGASSGQAPVELGLMRLKKLAETAGIPIVVAAHAEKAYQGEDSLDPIAAIIHSDAIERVADVVILLERADQYEPESPYAGEANLIVAKNRHGPTSTITVAYQYHFSRFLDIAPNGYVVPPERGGPPEGNR
jgi:replicative DNA helicase